MRYLIALVLSAVPLFAQQAPTNALPADDAIRIKEFYRLAATIQDGIWPGWGKTPTPLLLITSDAEFLTHHEKPPKEFTKVGEDVYARARQFPVGLQATFPAFGPPAVIAIGEPANTASKTSTPWLFTVMHEHFHQLQWAQPAYTDAIEKLGLDKGDATGMWMLNYAFPYDKPEVAAAFSQLRDLLLRAVNETDAPKFEKLAKQYVAERKKFFAQLSEDDGKYFNFQLWQEGIARYTEVKSAEAAAHYHPTAEFAKLSDFEKFGNYAATPRENTLRELKEADLAKGKRLVVYPFGAAEGFLLDRINPKWKSEYFQRMLSMDSYFETATISAHP